MTTDEERKPQLLDAVTNPWFIVLVFVAGYALAYLFYLKETVAYWYRWLRG